MKKIKKLISLVSAAAIIATSILSNTVFADFTDVSSDNQYSKSITTLSTLGVINGYDDGTFKPDGSITRAEFAKIITYVLGLSGLTTPSTEFSDNPTSGASSTEPIRSTEKPRIIPPISLLFVFLMRSRCHLLPICIHLQKLHFL